MRQLLGILVCAALGLPDCGPVDTAPHWEAERDAKASDSHPFAGFWKTPSCAAGDFGLAIGPMTDTTYYVSFCGPGGCFAKGTYRAVTPIHGDEQYRVADANTLEVKGITGFTRYVRCAERDPNSPARRAPASPNE